MSGDIAGFLANWNGVFWVLRQNRCGFSELPGSRSGASKSAGNADSTRKVVSHQGTPILRLRQDSVAPVETIMTRRALNRF
jgi:hypothetical protein